MSKYSEVNKDLVIHRLIEWFFEQKKSRPNYTLQQVAKDLGITKRSLNAFFLGGSISIVVAVRMELLTAGYITAIALMQERIDEIKQIGPFTYKLRGQR